MMALQATCIFSRVFSRIYSARTSTIRNFLTESYLCQEAWRERLKEPIIQKFKTSSYYYELDQKLNSSTKVSPVDIDIFANGITEKEYLEDLEELLHRFRRTPATVTAFESTSHAVIRTFLEFEVTDPLMRMLNDRVNYGIFHDFFTANIMMDYFLKKSNYRDAAKIATLLMLQEDFEHPLANYLALYSCHMYLQQPQPEPWDPDAEEPQEDDEEIMIRVRYIEQPYFDEHFDLRNHRELIGKTLVLLGKQYNDNLGLTSQLIGLGLFEKLDRAKALLQHIMTDKKQTLLKEGVEMFQKYMNEVPEKNDTLKEDRLIIASLLEKMIKDGQIIDGNMLKLIGEKIYITLNTCESVDTLKVQKWYSEWADQRQNAIDEQIMKYLRQEKIKMLIDKKKDIKEKEEIIFFFENFEKHRLNIPLKKEDEMINEEGKVSGKSLLHIPPEIEGKSGRFSKGIIEEHDPWWKWQETKLEEFQEDILANPNLVMFQGGKKSWLIKKLEDGTPYDPLTPLKQEISYDPLRTLKEGSDDSSKSQK